MKQLYGFAMMMLVALEIAAQSPSRTDLFNTSQVRQKQVQSSVLKNYPARSIGPVAQGGRIVDIDVNPLDPFQFYVALASGGIFKTSNNGITFQPVFDQVGTIAMGDIAVSPHDPQTIFAGTGEKNSNRSSYPGSGLYKSVDGGKTWIHAGLAGTHHISRIVFHPRMPEVAWVSAMGALYSSNPDRGLYKTTDGGKTWKKTLFINDSTGIIDVVVNPANPDQLIAAAWERTRRINHFKSSGEASAIYSSQDGGETWSKSVTGFPQGKIVGRTGLSACMGAPGVVYAVVDNQQEIKDRFREQRNKSGREYIEKIRGMKRDDFLQMDEQYLDQVLMHFNLLKKYTPAVVKQEVKEAKFTPADFADYLASFESNTTGVLGAEVFRSDDFGSSWKKMNTYNLDGVFNSYGYYFGEIMVSPADPDLVYLQGIPLLKSTDAGKTWHRLDTIRGPKEVHVDHHAMWINPKNPKNILLGNDGGLYQSYDEGATWTHLNTLPAGQFYTVNVDHEKPYNIYGGTQDNGVWKGSSDGSYWKSLFSGDGMYVIPEQKNPMTVYTGYHFGNYFRIELDKKKYQKITPVHGIAEAPLRWNWRTPLMMSSHDGTLYIGANKVLASTDKGETWKSISGDLTFNKKQGNAPVSTITSLIESPLKKGILYAGTDDGRVWMTSNAGSDWIEITAGLPAGKYISSMYASTHQEGTVFISLNDFRKDDFTMMIFMSTDYGKKWNPVRGDLPDASANVILQDRVSPDLLYAGTDVGLYISFDRGKKWNAVSSVPNVPVYDLVLHPVENDLVVATHGRSLYVVDAKPLQVVSSQPVKSIIAMAPANITFSDTWGQRRFNWDKMDKPRVSFIYHVSKAGKVLAEVIGQDNAIVKKFQFDATQGFNQFYWDLQVTGESTNPVYLSKGKYQMKYTSGKDSDTTAFLIQ